MGLEPAAENLAATDAYLKSEIVNWTVQLEISDFGFKMQDAKRKRDRAQPQETAQPLGKRSFDNGKGSKEESEIEHKVRENRR